MIDFQGKDMRAGPLSNLVFYRVLGRSAYRLGPLRVPLHELGFHGAFGDELGEDDEAYPNYSILYESNVFILRVVQRRLREALFLPSLRPASSRQANGAHSAPKKAQGIANSQP